MRRFTEQNPITSNELFSYIIERLPAKTQVITSNDVLVELNHACFDFVAGNWTETRLIDKTKKMLNEYFDVKIEPTLKEVGTIKNATIYFDEDRNMYYCDPDSSEGFYFDEQDLSCFSEDIKKEVEKLLPRCTFQ